MIRATKKTSRRSHRRGNIVVLAALFMVILITMVAFVVDFGYVLVAKSELQRAADAAAQAAVLEYRIASDANSAITAARNTASDYVLDNPVTKAGSTIDKNWDNADLAGDVVVGHFDFDTQQMTYGDENGYNAVRVRIRRNSTMNGEIPMFFARIMGYEGLPIEAEATAAIIMEISGLRAPGSGERVPFLPITVEINYWEDELAKSIDDFAWDPATLTASEVSGGDGVPEVVLYPTKVNSSGNYGTVNVGTSANSTAHLSDVIQNGLTQEHMDHHGGDLTFDSNGELMLTGDTGLSSGIKDDLLAIVGKPVAIPIYKKVTGPGNNAKFTIVKFVGVRIMEVDLKGGNKGISIQPADVTFTGVISSPTASTGYSTTGEQIYSPVAIVK